MNDDGTEAQWAKADVIVGNPPFLGDKKMLKELGDEYVASLRQCYKGRVAGGADLVCYWFDKARIQIEQGNAKAAGFVATNSIRGGANRTVLDNICKTLPIFEAWSDENWFDNGTAVRVSLVCFGHSTIVPTLEQSNDVNIFPFALSLSKGEWKNSIPHVKPSMLRPFDKLMTQHERLNLIVATSEHGDNISRDAIDRVSTYPTRLNGKPVALIHADLTAGDGKENCDLTKVKLLANNSNCCFVGTSKKASFDVSGEIARYWLLQPSTNGKSNCEVVKPWINGSDLVRRSSDTWIVDFGVTMTETDAQLYDLPFEYVLKNVKPEKMMIRSEAEKRFWWLHARTAPNMRDAVVKVPRYIATSIVAKYRIFVWKEPSVLPSHATAIIARADDTTFGILHSRFHELWALGLGTSLEDRPRYTPTTCFETFPFPTGLTPADTANNQESKLMSFDSPIAVPVSYPNTLAHAQAIAEAAFKLNQLRENWLNPAEWVEWIITPEEEKAGFPKRPKAKAGFEDLLKKRTLTNLYNDRPSWLNSAHQTLDKAVANAYGWTDYTPETTDADILQRLLKLNLTRS